MEREYFHLKDKVTVLNGSELNNYAGDWVDDMEDLVGLEFYISKFITDHYDETVLKYGVRLMDKEGVDVGWIFDIRCLMLACEDDFSSENFSFELATFYQ